MNTPIKSMLLAFLAVGLLAGCVPKSEAERLQSELDAAKASLATLQAEHDQLQVDYEALVAEYDSMSADYKAVQTELEETKQAANALQEQMEGLNNSNALLAQKIKKAKNISDLLQTMLIPSLKGHGEFSYDEARQIYVDMILTIRDSGDKALQAQFEAFRTTPESEAALEDFFVVLLEALGRVFNDSQGGEPEALNPSPHSSVAMVLPGSHTAVYRLTTST